MRHGLPRILSTVALPVLLASTTHAAIDLTGVFRAELSTPLVPDQALPCSVTFTQTGTALSGAVTCSILPPLPFTGTINTLFGIFSLSGSIPIVCPTLSITGLAAQNSYSFTGLLNCSGGPVPLAGTVTGSRCGNLLADPGETCDDGNWIPDDCCSATCQLAAPGAACAADTNPCTDDVCSGAGTCTHPSNTRGCDDGLVCTTGDVCGGGSCHGAFIAAGTGCDDGNPCTPDDTCDGAGTCVPAGTLDCGACMSCVPFGGCSAAGVVAPSCIRPAEPKNTVLLKHGATDDRDKALWTYAKGGATLPGDFGDPRTGTDYRLCIFDQSAHAGYDHALLGVDVPAGAGWVATASGFKWKSKTGLVRAVVLKAGAAGKSKIVVKTKGAVGVPPLPIDLTTPILVQLQASPGRCWQAEYGTAAKSTPVVFKAKNGSPSGAFLERR